MTRLVRCQDRRTRDLFLVSVNLRGARTAEAAGADRERVAKEAMTMFERSFGYICGCSNSCWGLRR